MAKYKTPFESLCELVEQDNPRNYASVIYIGQKYAQYTNGFFVVRTERVYRPAPTLWNPSKGERPESEVGMNYPAEASDEIFDKARKGTQVEGQCLGAFLSMCLAVKPTRTAKNLTITLPKTPGTPAVAGLNLGSGFNPSQIGQILSVFTPEEARVTEDLLYFKSDGHGEALVCGMTGESVKDGNGRMQDDELPKAALEKSWRVARNEIRFARLAVVS